VRHRLEYLIIAGVARAVRRLPRRLALAGGSLLGLMFYVFDAPHRRLAVANLGAAFPTRSLKERRAIARSVFVHFGRMLILLLQFSGRSRDEMLDWVEVEGDERVRQAHGLGKGVLLVTGHFGFWELHALVHGIVLGPIGVVARVLDNPYLNQMLERVRTCTGNAVIYRRGGLRRVMRTLASNQAVALLIDQHIHGGDAVYVDFFDRPAATTTALAALALRTGAPVIPVFSLPLADGRFRMIYEPPVDPPRPDHPDPVREFTQRCTDVLEMYVRRYPHVWLWMHRRWRDVEPAGAGAPGMFPRGERVEDNDALRIEE
jgi:KDO2-lipid IV(A) lauroyltransferase